MLLLVTYPIFGYIYFLRTHRHIALNVVWIASFARFVIFFFAHFRFSAFYNVSNHEPYVSNISFSKRYIHVIILYYIPFHSLICCPHLSCRPRLWFIFRVLSSSVSLSLTVFLCLCVNFCIPCFVRYQFVHFAVCFLCFCFPVHWIFIKGTLIIDSKTIDGIENVFVANIFVWTETKLRCGCQNGKKNHNDWKSVRLNDNIAKSSHYLLEINVYFFAHEKKN